MKYHLDKTHNWNPESSLLKVHVGSIDEETGGSMHIFTSHDGECCTIACRPNGFKISGNKELRN